MPDVLAFLLQASLTIHDFHAVWINCSKVMLYQTYIQTYKAQVSSKFLLPSLTLSNTKCSSTYLPNSICVERRSSANSTASCVYKNKSTYLFQFKFSDFEQQWWSLLGMSLQHYEVLQVQTPSEASSGALVRKS